jgi:hypothetical protein
MGQVVDNHGQTVPRCDLWMPLNPGSPRPEWKWSRCDRPLHHRGLCYLKRKDGSARGIGITKACIVDG